MKLESQEDTMKPKKNRFVIELKNIDKFYYTGVATQVLFDINLQFRQGSFNSIVGPSGSGKSTLMNIIGTLDKPTKGEIYIDAKRTDKMTKKELAELRNKSIGFVFQFHYLLPEYTALENVLLPHRISKEKITNEAKEEAKQIMEKASNDIEIEKTRAKREIERNAVDLSVEICEKVLEDTLDQEGQKKMIKHFISKVGNI